MRLERGTGTILPVLAEDWSISDDGLIYTFDVRQGVTWHDGQPFTADDVLFTFDEILPLSPQAASLVAAIADVAIVDESSVAITLNKPFAPFLISLTPEFVVIQPKHVYEGTDILNNPANLAPIGTGPFRFVSISADTVEYARYDGYWDQPKPYLDRLVFRAIPDAGSRMRALRTGEVDYVNSFNLDLAAIPELEADQNIVLDRGRDPAVQIGLMMYNTSREPLTDPRVRQALLMATDRNLIVSSAFGGNAEVARNPLSDNFDWAADPSVDLMEMYPYDLDAAADLLDQAGFTADANGQRFALEFLYRTDNPAQIAEIAKSGWEQIGVGVTIVPRESLVYAEDLFTNRDYDVAYISMTSRKDPELGPTKIYRCQPDFVPFTNQSYYCNDEVDVAFDAAAGTLDVDERAAQYAIAEVILARDVPTAFLATVKPIDAIRSNIGNLEEFNSGARPEVRWGEAFLSDL